MGLEMRKRKRYLLDLLAVCILTCQFSQSVAKEYPREKNGQNKEFLNDECDPTQSTVFNCFNGGRCYNVAVDTGESTSICPSGFLNISGQCISDKYTIIGDTWCEAKAKCKTENPLATLVSEHNIQQLECDNQLVQLVAKQSSWRHSSMSLYNCNDPHTLCPAISFDSQDKYSLCNEPCDSKLPFLCSFPMTSRMCHCPLGYSGFSCEKKTDNATLDRVNNEYICSIPGTVLVLEFAAVKASSELEEVYSRLIRWCQGERSCNFDVFMPSIADHLSVRFGCYGASELKCDYSKSKKIAQERKVRCQMVLDDKKNWLDVMRACASLNGRIASVSSVINPFTRRDVHLLLKDNGSSDNDTFWFANDDGSSTQVIFRNNLVDDFGIVNGANEADELRGVCALAPSISETTAVDCQVPSSTSTTSEITAESTVETTAEFTVETTIETTAESTVDITTESVENITSESTVETTIETTAESTLETTADSTVETTAESTVEVTAEATSGISHEISTTEKVLLTTSTEATSIPFETLTTEKEEVLLTTTEGSSQFRPPKWEFPWNGTFNDCNSAGSTEYYLCSLQHLCSVTATTDGMKEQDATIQHVLDVLENIINQLLKDTKDPQIVMKVTKWTTDIIDQLLDDDDVELWREDDDKKVAIVSQLLNLTDFVGIKLAATLEPGNSITFLKQNVDFRMYKLSVEHYFMFVFDDDSASRIELFVPENNELLAAVFYRWKSLPTVLPFRGLANISTFPTGLTLDPIPPIRTVNIGFDTGSDVTGTDKDTCIFFNTNSTRVESFYESSGCKLYNSTDKYSICTCDHLTTFTILTNWKEAELNDDNAALEVLTLIGCIASIFCLFVCIISIVLIRSLWNVRNVIHVNLCVCLLLGNVVLLVDSFFTGNTIACTTMAALLHFCFLSSFAWMFLEGLHLLLIVVNVFSLSDKTRLYYLAGYGIPLVLVGGTLTVTFLMGVPYLTSLNYCWLNSKNHVIWTFLGPVALVIVVNIVVLIIVLWKTQTIKMSKDKENAQRIRKALWGLAVLSPILGITWIFGFLFFTQELVVFAYMFAIFNSLQGVFIFIFNFLLNESTRTSILKASFLSGGGRFSQPSRFFSSMKTFLISSRTSDGSSNGNRSNRSSTNRSNKSSP